MRQQVNLYQPILRRERRVFSAQAMLIALAVAAFGLALIYGYGRWQVGALEERLDHLAAQRESARARLAKLDRALPPGQQSELLKQEIARVERQLEAQRRLLGAVERGALGNARGFSAHLEGLARQRVQGLWLTALRIGEGGRSVRLDGRTLAPERVPKLVQQLSAERAFAGLHFNALRMERPDEPSAPVDFVLATAAEDEGK